VDKRYAFFRACKESGEIHEYAAADRAYLADRQAREQAARALERAGLRMGPEAVGLFLQKVGTDTRLIVGEVEKLSVFAGKRCDISTEDVESVTSSGRGAAAWDLADAVGGRDLPKALRVLRQLLFQKQSPIGLLIGLEKRMRELSLLREAIDRGWLTGKGGPRRGSARWTEIPEDADRLFSEAFERDPRTTHPYRLGLLVEQARRFSVPQLRRFQYEIVETHRACVREGMPQNIALELLLIRMLAPASGSRRGRDA
jgi:DNA polymerase-3 subunit delta